MDARRIRNQSFSIAKFLILISRFYPLKYIPILPDGPKIFCPHQEHDVVVPQVSYTQLAYIDKKKTIVRVEITINNGKLK